jgi:hypothetical protein
MPDVVDHPVQAVDAVLRVNVMVAGKPPEARTLGPAVIVAHNYTSLTDPRPTIAADGG